MWVQHEVKKKRLQLYKTAGTRNIADLGTKAYPVAALELLNDLGFRQRRPGWQRECWRISDDSEGSEWATVGAVRQEPDDLYLERLRCIKEATKIMQEIMKSLSQATSEGEGVRGRRAQKKRN